MDGFQSVGDARWPCLPMWHTLWRKRVSYWFDIGIWVRVVLGMLCASRGRSTIPPHWYWFSVFFFFSESRNAQPPKGFRALNPAIYIYRFRFYVQNKVPWTWTEPDPPDTILQVIILLLWTTGFARRKRVLAQCLLHSCHLKSSQYLCLNSTKTMNVTWMQPFCEEWLAKIDSLQ